MITYVEHDAQGNLVSIVEIHTAEAHAVEPERPGMTPEERAERKARVDAAIEERENETRTQLAQAVSPNAGLIVLPKGAARPTHEGHKVDPVTKKVRAMTGAEKAAWVQAHTPPEPPVHP